MVSVLQGLAAKRSLIRSGANQQILKTHEADPMNWRIAIERITWVGSIEGKYIIKLQLLKPSKQVTLMPWSAFAALREQVNGRYAEFC